ISYQGLFFVLSAQSGAVHSRGFQNTTISRSKRYKACSDMARGNNPNPLRLSAVLLEEYPIGLLTGGAFAPYKRFAAGKTLVQGQFTCPEHF
ncbi:hypothetical protein, partial [uncultured Intestinimonas sp.]|uniref:hypothetical protein n=1 Tax=uncultured Intestinimonas sp. TaxID=1689265 RepID=UPI0029425EA6